MIERVAKAIRLRDTTDEYAMAREAIKAMREPTENMIDEGWGTSYGLTRENAKDCYIAMIDSITT